MNRRKMALGFRGTGTERHLAFEQLWKEFYPKGISYLRAAFPSLGGSREDVLQEAFLKAFSLGETYNPAYAPSTWFYTILRSKALDLLRTRKTGNSAEAEQADMAAAGTWAEPEAQAVERDEERRVREFLDTLSEENRSLVWLRYREDLGLGEIAEITGRPLGTVKSDFARIRKLLSAWWEKEERNEN